MSKFENPWFRSPKCQTKDNISACWRQCVLVYECIACNSVFGYPHWWDQWRILSFWCLLLFGCHILHSGMGLDVLCKASLWGLSRWYNRQSALACVLHEAPCILLRHTSTSLLAHSSSPLYFLLSPLLVPFFLSSMRPFLCLPNTALLNYVIISQYHHPCPLIDLL